MNFGDVADSIRENNPAIGKYGGTLVSSVRKLEQKCDPDATGDFVHVFNDHERTFKCMRAVTRNDKTLKSNVSHIVGVARRYVPGLAALVKPASMKFWNAKIAELDKSIREADPENDMGEDPSWKNLTWKKIVASKKKLELGTFERLAIDVYTTPGVPPRRGEWAHVIAYASASPKNKPPEQNWMYIPEKGNKGAFVEFNAFKTHKHTNSQKIEIAPELVKSVRETFRKNGLAFPSNIFGLDNFNPHTQSNKFNALLMRALNRALERTDIKRPANLLRHTFLTDVFHNRLSKMTDTDLKTVLSHMATSLEQAMYTYRIAVKQSGGDAGTGLVGGGAGPIRVGAGLVGGGAAGGAGGDAHIASLEAKVHMLNELLEALSP